ncbi:MAG: tail fiber domain-containing protein [Planctomycetota bacterium]
MRIRFVIGSLIALAAVAPSSGAIPFGTGFTYQGQLKEGDVPLNALADFQFTLWSHPSGGSIVGATLELNDVPVVNGLFTVFLEFDPPPFQGPAVYLAVAVKTPPGSGTFTPLSPRQGLTAAPFAVTALSTVGVDGHSLDAADGNPTDALFVDNAGQVGIGTTAPENTLHVHKGSAGVVTGYSNAPLVIENSTHAYINLLTPDASERGLLFGSPTEGTTAGGIIYNSATTREGLQFRTGGNVNRMVIDSTGNVGIGTQDPTALLHLKQATNQYAIRMEAERFVSEPVSNSDSTSTVTQIAGDGSGWLNPGSAGALDGASASTVLTTPTGDAASDELDFRNFGFNLPGDAVIRNVRIAINGSHTGGCSTCAGIYAKLVFLKQARLADGATFGPVRSLREQTVSGTFINSGNDLWGLPLTPAIVNSSSFGVRVRVRMIPVTTDPGTFPSYIPYPSDCPTTCTANATAMINAITVTIQYGAPTLAHAEYTVGIGPGSTDFRISPSSDFSVVSFAVNQDGIVNIGPVGSGIMLNVFGGAAKNGGGSWSSISDARLKHDIVPLQGTLDRLLTLRGRSYEFNDDEVKSGRALPGRQIGLIAQEVEEVFPDWIDYTKDGYRMVTERATTALMVESLRDLRREKDEGLAAQQHQIDALRQENAELLKRLEALEARRR